ncbi:MAG: phospholipase A, partial [Mucilaginibacter sp.]
IKVTVPTLQSRFSEYEPNYIISNFGQDYYGQVKFKISFKFDLKLKSEINKFYFAFTQIAFWDLYQQSAPMREFDLSPALYYEHRLRKSFSMGSWLVKWNNYQLGYLHESNGQAGAGNRSIFKVIANTDIDITRKKPEQITFTLSQISLTFRTWIWNMVDNENKYIADYRGYGQLVSAFKFDYGMKANDRPYQLVLTDIVTPARVGISNELSLEFDPFIGHLDYDWIPYLFAQYFHGYGEGLLNYDNRDSNFKPVDVFRIGVRFRVF